MSEITTPTNTAVVVCALYKFVRLPNYVELRTYLLATMQRYDIKGTLLLADEGINGTVASSREGIDHLLQWLVQQPGLDNIVYKESYDQHMPFYRTKVKLKKEIVTMGVAGIDPNKVVGTYVKPKDWNALICDPDVLLIDTRNDYEIKIGTFENAVNPNTDTFREFPQYVKDNLDPKKHKKVAMFCTGGIRCEKSTAYLKEQGFDDVFHLEGGILKYLEEVPSDDTMFQGDCFVFDNRVAVNHDLKVGDYDQCHACRMPITQADKVNEHYVKGVSCLYCIDKHTPEQLARFKEREKQIGLAQQRGQEHIGNEAKQRIVQNRAAKLQRKAEQRQD